jgi:hypothetical protein
MAIEIPRVPTRNVVLPISKPIVGVSGKVYHWTDSCGVGDVRDVKTTDSGRSTSNSASLGKRVKWDKGRWREIGLGSYQVTWANPSASQEQRIWSSKT